MELKTEARLPHWVLILLNLAKVARPYLDSQTVERLFTSKCLLLTSLVLVQHRT
jgi:hypothetical protein